MPDDPAHIALKFNDRINDRDAAGLAALMSADHRLVDRSGMVVSGRDAAIAAWTRFFSAFPEYHNTILAARASGQVAVLHGYATWHSGAPPDHVTWTATVAEGLVAEWRIDADTVATATASPGAAADD